MLQAELVLSIKNKLSDLHSMKGWLDIEMKENEALGTQVKELAKELCSEKEYDKFISFAQEVDKIINLLLSLSGRMARVENAIVMLSPDAYNTEVVSLL